LIGVQRAHAVNGAQHFVAPELFYRLKVLELDIPALRDRVRDLEHIVNHMLRRLAPDQTPEVADATMSILERYSFPGNLLELAHALTHAFVLARAAEIQPHHLPASIRQGVVEEVTTAPLPDGDLEALEIVIKRFERDYLLRVLRTVHGNRGRAAEILGLSRKGLWGKLKAHGISDVDIEQVG
jgi:DNA-binding NtrC family response regulator